MDWIEGAEIETSATRRNEGVFAYLRECWGELSKIHWGSYSPKLAEGIQGIMCASFLQHKVKPVVHNDQIGETHDRDVVSWELCVACYASMTERRSSIEAPFSHVGRLGGGIFCHRDVVIAVRGLSELGNHLVAARAAAALGYLIGSGYEEATTPSPLRQIRMLLSELDMEVGTYLELKAAIENALPIKEPTRLKEVGT